MSNERTKCLAEIESGLIAVQTGDGGKNYRWNILRKVKEVSCFEMSETLLGFIWLS